jgi:hypothetical protein
MTLALNIVFQFFYWQVNNKITYAEVEDQKMDN